MTKVMIKKICIIGVGRMGNALLSGYMNAGFSKEDFSLVVRNIEQRDKLINQGFKSEINFSIIKNADIIFIAVKPGSVEIVLEELKKTSLLYRKPIVSVCAGFTYEQFKKKLGHDHPVFRIRPNIFININKGNILFSENENLKYLNLKIEKFFKKLGTVYKIEESLLTQFTWDSSTISGVILSRLIEENFKTVSPQHTQLVMSILLSGLNGFCDYVQHLFNQGMDPIQIFRYIHDQIVSPNGLNDNSVKYLAGEKFFDNFINAKTKYIDTDRLLSKSLL